MSTSSDAVAAVHGLPVRNGLLPPAVRRDLADLNSQYLELGLVGAAQRDSAGALQWTHCVGLCLFGSDGIAVAPASAEAAARRRTRR